MTELRAVRREAGGTFDDIYGEAVAAFEEVALLAGTDAADLDDVLRLVGQRLCELLAVRRCSVYLRRKDGRFQGQVGYCDGRSIDTGVSRLVSGVERDDFTAEILRTAAPVFVSDATRDPRTIQRTMRQWGVRDMLGVPLVVGGDVIGIIYTDNLGTPHKYSARDVRLAQAFAGLAALAVRQGWLYKQVGERAALIEHQRRVLSQSEIVQNKVTRAVLDGADIPDILRLVANLLLKPLVLYDPDFHITAWAAPSEHPLTRCPGLTADELTLPIVTDGLAELERGSSPVMLRATHDLRVRRLLAKLVVDSQCAGYVELCEIGRGFSQVDAKALEQTAMGLSIKLLSTQRNRELRRQHRAEFFADLLYERCDGGSIDRRALHFGLDPAKPHVLLRVQFTNSAGDDRPGSIPQRGLLPLMQECLPSDHKCVAQMRVPGAELALVETPRGLARFRPAMVEALAPMVAAHANNAGVRCVIVSEPCMSLDAVSAAGEKLREIVELLRVGPDRPRLHFAGDLEVMRLVSRGEGVYGLLSYSREVLRPLITHDAANAGALVETLEAFVQAQGKIRSTAAALMVHENTVRYRLGRIRALSSIDPDRMESLLLACVLLQARALFMEAE